MRAGAGLWQAARMGSELHPMEPRLEGPGSEARLRSLQRRFARIGRRLEARGLNGWRLALLCTGAFLTVLVVGLLVTG